MSEPSPPFVYDLDDRPPPGATVLYGLQWAVIMFPALVMVGTLGATALHLDPAGKIRFLQLTLLVSGLFTCVQSLWGHRYPVLEGPASALLLTFMILAPGGIAAIQGGTILGGLLLMVPVLLGRLGSVVRYATPNVTGVIMMLISITLVPFLSRTMTYLEGGGEGGNLGVFLISLGMVLATAALSHRLKGFWKTVSLLLSMAGGTIIFTLLGWARWDEVPLAGWLDLPRPWTWSAPVLDGPALAALAASYVAVLVNSLGSLHGIAGVTEARRLPSSISRGLLFNGLAGVVCGCLGLIGLVSYSVSPGVVLANRVASRYTTAACGVILMTAALIPKLSTVLASVPSPVVSAALCVAMGTQIGAALAVIARAGIGGRDYVVVGVPVLLGTMATVLPADFLAAMPQFLRVFLGNGLVLGIVMVVILEHGLLREPGRQTGGKRDG